MATRLAVQELSSVKNGMHSQKDKNNMKSKIISLRMVAFDSLNAKSFYKLPEKLIKSAISELESENILISTDFGYMLVSDAELLKNYEAKTAKFVYALHRNDFLVKSNEHILKENILALTEGLEYDRDALQYLLIDGEFHGASVGHFRNGPYDLNDIVCDLSDAQSRKDEIIKAISDVNFGKMPDRFMGRKI